MDTGYIKLHRKLLENPITRKPKYLALWVILLLKANHKETELLWNGENISLKPGQFITGRKQLSVESGIPEGTVEGLLTYMEKGCGRGYGRGSTESRQQIRQQKNNKFRIITIVNWEKYQIGFEKLDNKTDNQPTTNRQPADTDKNDNNDKNEKNTNIATSPDVAGKEVNDLIDLFKYVNPVHERLFKDKTQRACMERLIKKLGADKVKGAIEVLPRTNAEEFSPKIFTPYELEKKLAALIAFVQNEERNKSKNRVVIL